MKQYLYLIVTVLVFAACNGVDESSVAGNSNIDEKENKNVSKRDYSITRQISYSDLFLDSMAMENFINSNKEADSIARRMRSFYNARNYQFAWFNSDGLNEETYGFWNLLDHYTTYSDDSSLTNKSLKKRIDAMMMEDNLSVSASNKNYVQTELLLTMYMIRYMLKNYEKGFIKRKELERFVPIKKRDPIELADSLIKKKHKDDKYFEDINEPYRLLKEQLGKYLDIAKKGGWQQITVPKKGLKKGSNSPELAKVKQHLMLTGDLTEKDTSSVFNDTLETALKSFQQRHGLSPTGTLGTETVKELNVPVESRLREILINMDRMRWMPSQPEGNLILVNIPEFQLHVMDGKKKVFDMKIVVGKEGHNTMMFTKTLNQIVFSPYWNVPPAIVKDELLKEIEKDPKYLEKQDMEVIGEEDGLPDVRQKPGTKNALGKVKFLFPNSYNIYFHDTPQKSLFSKDKRAFSHGCIRLAEPEKMARYLLRNDSNWDDTKIRDAMDSGKEKYVKLKDPVAVFITYFTAWVDEQGKLNFREDIYDHDSNLGSKMFL